MAYVPHQLNWGQVPSRTQSFDFSMTSNESSLITATSVPASTSLGHLKYESLPQSESPEPPDVGQRAWLYCSQKEEEDGGDGYEEDGSQTDEVTFQVPNPRR